MALVSKQKISDYSNSLNRIVQLQNISFKGILGIMTVFRHIQFFHNRFTVKMATALT